MQGILIEFVKIPYIMGAQMLSATMRVSTREEFEGLKRFTLHNISFSFVTNKEIRETITQRKLQNGYPIGELSAFYEEEAKRLSWSTYEPKKTGAFVNVRGIGQLLEAKFLQKAKEVFPHTQIIYHSSPSIPRKDQLRNRGFVSNKNEEFEETFEAEMSALLRKIAADTVKHRKGEKYAEKKGWIGPVKRAWKLPLKYRRTG